jgi:hypothetical protein
MTKKKELLSGGWIDLQPRIMKATEEELVTLMAQERLGLARTAWLLRIHARYNRLRAERERKELMRA